MYSKFKINKFCQVCNTGKTNIFKKILSIHSKKIINIRKILTSTSNKLPTNTKAPITFDSFNDEFFEENPT